MQIDLTESILMEATQQHCGIADRLRKLGFTITIDDFAAGNSSLI